MHTYDELIPLLCETAQIAGARIMQDWRRPMDVMRKHDNSLKTCTDDAAEEIILKALLPLSSLPVVAEEQYSRSQTPKAGSSNDFWLIDALDGTRQFVAGAPDFSVNIALIRNNQPVLGIIHAPVTGDTWFASQEKGAFHTKMGEQRKLSMHAPNPNALRVLASRTATSTPPIINALIGQHSAQEVGMRSSSLKFCLLAENQWDLYPRLGNTYEWDTAAGDIILREAGGLILDTQTGAPLDYNKSAPDYLNNGFIAAHAALFKGPFAKLS